ncbi:MAG: AMP-binding protein, partial [Myxococcota bacterium]|nr:AMP-binding protein [Myxococcota bacterium]
MPSMEMGSNDIASAGTIPALLFASQARFGADTEVQWYEDGVLHAMSREASIDQVRHLAAGLIRLGVSPGDRVAIISETNRFWSACDFAILCVGAVTVGIYPTSTAEEVLWILEDS